MKKFIRIFCLIGVIIFGGCEREFIETDLTGKTLTILAPTDRDTVSTTTPLFWWNKIRGARNYRIQIVYPDFNSPQTLLYDTAVDADRFYPTLIPGRTYWWRIRPENGSTRGNWATRSVTVDSTISLSAQQVVITFPSANGYASSNGTISFSWNTVSGATFYRINITNTTTGSNVTSTTSSLNNFSYTFAQGNYSFSVRAENSNSITAWSVRTFSIDQTAPTAPQLIFPANNAFYSTPPSTINFDWTSASDAVTDSLYIATDSTFSSGIISALLLNSSQSSYVWTGAQVATIYFWQVRSMDAAGNKSNYSAKFKITDN